MKCESERSGLKHRDEPYEVIGTKWEVFSYFKLHASYFALPVLWAAVIAVFCMTPAVGGTDPPAVEPVEVTNCPRPALETLHYEFGWNGIAAAVAKIHISQEMQGNDPVIHIKGEARTIGLVRRMWKMNDQMEVWVHPATLRPFRVRIHRVEAGTVYRTSISFFPKKKTASIVNVKGKKIKKKEIKYGNAYDPLTLILVVRCLDFKVGRPVTFDVLESKRIYRAVFDVMAEEEIEVEAGRYNAFKILPSFYRLTDDGKIKKDDSEKVEEVFMWVSADPQRHLLKVKSKVFVGSVYGELTGIER